MQGALFNHLKSGSTTVCRAWLVRRADAVVFGFTDHDQDLSFDGATFRARSGLTAKALQLATGLSVDNSEAAGALSDDALTEADIAAGRYDAAEVTIWLVNWADVSERSVLFRGSFGEISRKGGAFRVELRGLAEKLNVVQGRAFVPDCAAQLGDRACGVDLSLPGHRVDTTVQGIVSLREIAVPDDPTLPANWFAGGRIRVLSGAAAGLSVTIESERVDGDLRRFHLWHALPVGVAVGDAVTLEVGCDGLARTCQVKFGNLLNFRGFPTIPGESWLRGTVRADR